ncbi:TetR/AcrR family transcriptional regulator [Robinsoniella sp. KNHs210]|uniref:TetR/AcrR family transcriptional regulator n=1 Tax=Robinsoniella sp. KNHs210 TaxID=1469950 RepID=UPI0004826840|nr:TetR/AcrR family transcriptional regulator [Robinsoniella sp. KNHs210]
MNRRGTVTRRLILKKSYPLFAEKGFKEVTMKDICECTGLSRGGLYRHYDSTSQIFAEILEELLKRQEDEFSEKIKKKESAFCILNDVLERYRLEMLDSGNSLSVAIYEFYSLPQSEHIPNALLEQYLLSKEMWSRLIQYGIEQQEFKQVDIPAVFDLIVFSYQGVRMYSRLMPLDKDIPDRIVRQIKELLLPPEGA